MEKIFVTHDRVKVKHISDYVYALNIRNGEVAPQYVINVTDEQKNNCKYFSSQGNRTEWLRLRNEFIDYVMGFYGPQGLYKDMFGNGVTRDDIMFATNAIDKVGSFYGKTGSYHIDQADSISRELVRDYLFLCRGYRDVEYSLVKKWFQKNLENSVVEHQFLMKDGKPILKCNGDVEDLLKSLELVGMKPALRRLGNLRTLDARMNCIDNILSIVGVYYDYSVIEDDIKNLAFD